MMISINGYEWKIFSVSPDSPFLMHENGTFALGMCDRDIQTIYINDELSGLQLKKVICHELVHASMYSYNIFLNSDQEEIIADLIATYGEEIIYITNKIFKKLKGVS